MFPFHFRLAAPCPWSTSGPSSLRGVFFISPISPFSPPPFPDLFFSYITCLKMALFKSIRHPLQSEKGHVALLRAPSLTPPHTFTTLFDFCDFKAEPHELIRGPRVRLGLAGVGNSGTAGLHARCLGLGHSEEKTSGVCSGWRGGPGNPQRMPGAPRSWEETCSGPKCAMDHEGPAPAHALLSAVDGDWLEPGFPSQGGLEPAKAIVQSC